MVRKITALLMVLSVAVLCTAPAFADDLQFNLRIFDFVRFGYINAYTGNTTNAYLEISNTSPVYTLDNGLTNASLFIPFSINGNSDNSYLRPNYTYNISIVTKVYSSSSLSIGSNSSNLYAVWPVYNNSTHSPANFNSLSINSGYFRPTCDISLTTSVYYSTVNGQNLATITDSYVVHIPSNFSNPTYSGSSPIGLVGYMLLGRPLSFNFEGQLQFYSFSASGNGNYDLDGSVYDAMVVNQLQGLENSIDNLSAQNHQDLTNIKNNLNSIDSSVQGVGDKVDDMSQDIQDKMEEIKQQEADDIQDGYDSAEDAGEALEEGIDLTFTESIDQLYNSISYNGTDFNFQLPASGTIPFLNAQLWNTQNIPLKQYIDYMPPVVLIVIRFLLGLGFALYVVHEVRSIISMINGSKGD